MADAGAEVETRLLRTDDDPFWVRLRELVTQRGIDPQQAALAISFPDDSNLEFGILVTPDLDVYEFDFVYGLGDIKTSIRTGTLAAWNRTTDRWRERPFRADVEAAMAIIDRESA